MKRSEYFLPTLKEVPAEAQIISHQLMLRAGMIQQTAAGIYNFLPLGVRVLEKIQKIIEEEQDKILGQKIIMPTLQQASLWKESGRFDAYGEEMLRINDRHGRELLYGPTAEEVVTDIARNFIQSYKQLPLYLYQIHWKFRDEIRPRFGVMRGREFLMKDGYSFDLDFESAKKTYVRIFDSYVKIFDKIFEGVPDPYEPSKNIKIIPVQADPGAIGGDLTHEFQIMAKTGENEIFYDAEFENITERNYETLTKHYAASEEKHDREKYPNARSSRGIELGHIFYFGTKYSQPMNFTVLDQNGKSIHPHGGSYGIGVSRMIAAIIETSYDDRGIVWPKAVSPFDVGIINLLEDKTIADDLYEKLMSKNVSVLYDERIGLSAGVKFADMDLIGLPYQIIIGKSYTNEKKFEIKNRRTGNKELLELNQIFDFIR